MKLQKIIVVLAGLASLAFLANASSGRSATAALQIHDGQRDFDFLVGSWTIHLRKRLRPLTGSNEWVEADGTVVCRHIFGGKGEVEEFDVSSKDGSYQVQGLATRLYNPKTRQWSIFWANAKNGTMDTAAQIGGFQNGRGTFDSNDTLDGKPILIRFSWTQVDTPHPHFEQSFSADGGKTWEVNWITEQARVRPKA